MNARMFEKIEDYLNGTMTVDEKQLFEVEMAGNQELASAFKVYKAIEEEMRSKEKHSEAAAALKSTLDKTQARYFKGEANHNNELTDRNEVLKPATNTASTIDSVDRTNATFNKPRRTNQWTRFAIAAVILAVVALSTTWYLRNTKDTQKIALNNKPADTTAITPDKKEPLAKKDLPNKSSSPVNHQPNQKIPPYNKARQSKSSKALFAQNFKPDAAPQHKEGLLEEPLQLYADKNYKDAIETFEMAKAALETRGNSNTKLTYFNTHYYLALSYLAADTGLTTAITELNAALNSSPDNLLKSKAMWYLALAYLKNGDINKAEALLKKIVSDNTCNCRQKAIDLIPHLNRDL
jgi:tetratricopeptide (TPR) repeat protein